MALDDPPFIPLRIQFPRLLQWYSIRVILPFSQELLFFIGQESSAVRHKVSDLIEWLSCRVYALEGRYLLPSLRLCSRESEALTVTLELRVLRILMSGTDIPYTTGQFLLHLIQNRPGNLWKKKKGGRSEEQDICYYK